MSFEILTRQPIRFYEKQGIKFFEGFNAVDKFKKPLQVFFEDTADTATLVGKNYKNKESLYTLQFKIPKREMEGVSLSTTPHNEGIGEVLNLAALMELRENNLNRFNVFALKESIQFYARYGFKILSEDVDEILHNLRMVMKSKSERLEKFRYEANFFYPKISGKVESDDPFLKQRGCDVVSNYLKELSRHKVHANSSDLKYSANMRFTDWEFETNRDYLNSLLDAHEINYKI